MNPKDMTGRALFIASKDSYSSKKQHAGISLLNWIKDQEAIELELLRRLDEADALRKENEGLLNLFGECPKRNNRLGTYSDAKPVQIDVCKLICITKESEASHEG